MTIAARYIRRAADAERRAEVTPRGAEREELLRIAAAYRVVAHSLEMQARRRAAAPDEEDPGEL